MERNIGQEIIEGLQAYRDYQQGKITLKTIERESKPAAPITPSEVKHLRNKLNLSQAVFARKLQVSVRTYQEWEQGKRKPNAQASILLKLIQREPSTVDIITAL